MQTPSATLAPVIALRESATSVTRTGLLLFEVYAHDYYPTTEFDPDDAFAWFAQTSITWNGNVYRRQILSHSSIARLLTSAFNRVSMTFANNDQFMSQFVIANEIEGMRLVIRYIARGVSAALADSIVVFTGRLERQSSLSEEECTIEAKQDLASINYDIPKRTFSPVDPLNRSPNDPEYEGFKFNTQTGFFKISTVVTKRFLGFFNKKKVKTETQQYTSEDGTNRDQTVPLVLGRCQMELIPVWWADVGFFLVGLFVAAGHKVTSITNIINRSPGFQFPAHIPDPHDPDHNHLGDIGGTGTNAAPDLLDGTNVFIGPYSWFPGNTAYLSRTAYVGAGWTGPDDFRESSPNTGDDAVPIVTAIVMGEADLPDGANDFTLKGFTDNPAYLARLVLTNSDMIGIDSRLINDDACIETAAYCEEPILDETNAELLPLIQSDADALANGDFERHNSSGLLNSRYYNYVVDDSNPNPWTEPRTDPTIFTDPVEDPTPHPTVLDAVPFYRKRYTFNSPLTDKTGAVRFLFDTLYPSARLYTLFGPDGKLRIKTERPADSSFLLADAAIGATEVHVNDIEPWVNSLQGLALIGVGLATSETRVINDVDYLTAGNSITTTAADTGTIVLAVGGATLSGGTASIPPSGTYTVSGTPAAGNTLTATIDGVPTVYLLDGDDTVESVAAGLATAINANVRIKSYIRAVWDGADEVTVYSKLGKLKFVSALVNAHEALLDPPASGPTASGVAGGSLIPGTYKLAYSYQNAVGETFISPITDVVVTSGQRIQTTTITMPGNVDALNWYMSKAADDPSLAFLVSNTGTSFLINVLPDSTARGVPLVNSAGEETIRVMASFTSRNIRTGQFTWPLPSRGSSINQVLIKYREATDDFAERELYVNDYVHQAKISKINKVEIDGSGIDNFHQASRIANTRLAKEREGNFFVEWATDEAGIVFEEGDVVCATDASGGFVNLPLRIEEIRIQDNLDVTFVGRLYSTIMYSDEAGQHPIALPSTLKYMNQAPPAVSNVALFEDGYITPNNTWISKIVGTFDFGEFFGGQVAKVYLKLEGEADYRLITTVIPNEDNEGVFEILGVPLTASTGHSVKIVTESKFGYTLGLAAATEYLVIIDGPVIPPPEDIVIYRDQLTETDIDQSQQIQIVIPTGDRNIGEIVKYWVDVYSDTPDAAFTVNASTNVFTSTAHGLTADDTIALSSSGTLPAPLDKEAHYYLRDIATDTFKLSLTPNGAAIDLTNTGSGTHSWSLRKRHMSAANVGTFNPAVLMAFDPAGAGTWVYDETAGSGGWLKTIKTDYFGRNEKTETGVDGDYIAGAGFTLSALATLGESGDAFEFTMGRSGSTPALDTEIDFQVFANDEEPDLSGFVYRLTFTTVTGATGFKADAYRWQLHIYEGLSGSPTLKHTEPDYEIAPMRYRVQLSGSELRVYRDYGGPGSTLLYRSSTPIPSPLRPVITGFEEHEVLKMKAGGSSSKAVSTYPDTDMAADFGVAVSAVPETFRFRVYEERVFINGSFFSEAVDFIS
jgi:hypothetical protein